MQVARRVDHLWTGALVGAFLGALVGVRSTEHTRDASPVGGALFQAMPFMAVGAFIGANIPRHAVVYSTTSSTKVAVSPLVSAHRKGLALSFEF